MIAKDLQISESCLPRWMDQADDGAIAEYVAIEARNLASLPGDVDFAVGASLQSRA